MPSISPSIGSKLLQQLSSERLDDARATKIIALLARASAADVTSTHGGYGRPLTHVLLAQHDRPDLVDALLAARADIGATDNDGRTALHWAASAGRLQSAITLLSHNADSTRRDEERLYLHVEPKNTPAVRLYESSGYERLPDVPPYASFTRALNLQERAVLYCLRGLDELTAENEAEAAQDAAMAA